MISKAAGGVRRRVPQREYGPHRTRAIRIPPRASGPIPRPAPDATRLETALAQYSTVGRGARPTDVSSTPPPSPPLTGRGVGAREGGQCHPMPCVSSVCRYRALRVDCRLRVTVFRYGRVISDISGLNTRSSGRSRLVFLSWRGARTLGVLVLRRCR